MSEKNSEEVKNGRPSDYTPELGDLICSQIAAGISLHKICQEDETLPSSRTVYTWLRRHPEFLHNYNNSKEDQADKMVEEILEIADDGTNDYMIKLGKDGEEVGSQLNTEHVTRSRLRVDARKWVASKFQSKKYGDKVTTEHTGSIGLTDMSDTELEKKKRELEKLLKKSVED